MLFDITVVFLMIPEWILLVLVAPEEARVLPPMKSWSRFWSSSE